MARITAEYGADRHFVQPVANSAEQGVGAGSGNRTRIASLEGWCFTTKLYPLIGAASDCHRGPPSVKQPWDGARRSVALEGHDAMRLHSHILQGRAAAEFW